MQNGFLNCYCRRPTNIISVKGFRSLGYSLCGTEIDSPLFSLHQSYAESQGLSVKSNLIILIYISQAFGIRKNKCNNTER